jgi:hypothetical protein
MNKHAVFDVYRHFDQVADSMLVDISTACTITKRSRASIYRHFKSGDLNMVKVGNSTRIKVGDLRRLIGASTEAA